MSRAAHRWLTVWVGEVPLALPLEQIAQVILWIPPQPAPPGQGGLIGVLQLRGQSWPVWDLGRIWGWGARRPTPETSIVLAHPSEGERLALVVDRVGWVVEAEPEALARRQAIAEFFSHTIVDPETGTEHFVVSLQTLLSRPGMAAQGV